MLSDSLARPRSTPSVSENAVPRKIDPWQNGIAAGYEEELEMSHEAFHRAFAESKLDSPLLVPGLQEFAAALYQRRRFVTSGRDPLLHIFDEVGRGGGDTWGC